MGRRQWLAYGDGSYEAVDPAGNLNRKKRGPGREDWWVMEQDEGWEPPFGMERPMNKPSAKAEGILPGEWDWMDRDKAQKAESKRDRTDDEAFSPLGRPKQPAKPTSTLADGPGFLNKAGRSRRSLVGDGPAEKKPEPMIRSAHGAARTGKDGRTEVRLLDRGLDPEVKVKTRRKEGSQGSGQDFDAAKSRGLLAPTSTQAQGSDLSGRRWNGPKIGPKPEPKPEPKTGAWSSLLGKTFQHEPQERNPNQTAREMEELARRPESSAKQARDMEGLDKSVRKVPRQAPDGVLGSPEYYRWRAEEFKQRHPDKEPPDYLLNYGDKYAKIFRDEIRPNLTDEGKKWVDRTMRGLQERMEKAYKDGTLDEMDPKAFKDFATGIHSDVYNKEGFGELSDRDVEKVWKRLMAEDEFWEWGTFKEMMEVSPQVLGRMATRVSPSWRLSSGLARAIWD